MSIIHKDQKGAVLVLVAVMLTGFLALAALVIDIGNFHVVGNEIQNAADAGALAGAQELVNPVDMSINTALVNELAKEAAMKNLTGMNGVAIKSIRIGHWTFPDGPFQANTNPYQLSVIVPDLNIDPDFINAVEVTVTRSDATWLAQAFYPRYYREKTAVAYTGAPANNVFNAPLMMCVSMVGPPGSETCQSIRESNSQVDTGGWTNFAPCGADGPHPKEYVCGGHPPLSPGSVHLPPGQANSAFKDLRECWLKNKRLDRVDAGGNPIAIDQNGIPVANGDGIPDQPWKMKLPVIQCLNDQVTSCEEIIGVVEVEFLWITTHQGNQQATVPPFMLKTGMDPMDPASYWKKSDYGTDGEAWTGFVEEFALAGNPSLNSKEIYVLPSCSHRELETSDFAGDIVRIVLVD